MGLDNSTKVIKNIEINVGKRDGRYIEPIFCGLNKIKKVNNCSVENTKKGEQGDIFVNNVLVASIDYSDFKRLWSIAVNNSDYKIVFKYQYDPDTIYPDKVVSAGYVTTINDLLDEIEFSDRDIDVTARMRDHQGHPERKYRDWSICRKETMLIAIQLGKEGYHTVYGKTKLEDYANELKRCKVGFNWRGIGHLNFRIIEYIQSGIAMISDDLSRYPIREDVYLKHDETAIFCSSPDQFCKEAKLLLKDKDKLNKISSNVLELWANKLCPAKMGEWYYNKLREVV